MGGLGLVILYSAPLVKNQPLVSFDLIWYKCSGMAEWSWYVNVITIFTVIIIVIVIITTTTATTTKIVWIVEILSIKF